MDRALSNKLRTASFVATIFVVIRHSANIQAFYSCLEVPYLLSSFESGTVFVTDVAVPFFFFASGFFFMSHSYYGLGPYVEMLKKKLRTLFVPFAFWNMCGAFVLCVYDKHGVLGNSFMSCVHNFFMSSWYGPLWYVRDIMLMMALYPLYGWMLYKRWTQLLLAAFIVYWMYARWCPGWCDLLTGEGVIFFFLGGLFQKHKGLLSKRSPRWLSVVALLVWLLMSYLFTSWDGVAHRISLLIAIPAFWMSLDLVSGNIKEWCLRLAPYSFLIYVTHFYLQKAIKTILAHFFEGNVWMALFAFFLVPLVCVITTILVGKYWKRWSPKSYSICVGGR